MSKIFTQDMLRLLAFAGIAVISLSAIFSRILSKLMGSFAPYRKVTVIYLLVVMVLMGLVGFLGNRYTFRQPGLIFIICQLLFLMAGFLNIRYMHKYLTWSGKENTFWYELLFTVIAAGFGLIGFVIVFTWMNTEGYQFFMCTSLLFFILAFLIRHTFIKAISIPMKIYSKWYYPIHQELADPDEAKMKNMLVISFEFQKKITDKYYTNFRAKAPADMDFDQLFYYFINDYNERHPNAKIEFVNEQGAPYGWVFYKKPRWYSFGTKYIKTDISFFLNRVRENDIIVCSRV